MHTARRLMLLGFLLLIAGWTSCGNGTQTPPVDPPPPPKPGPKKPEFDADRAFTILEKQVSFGPRAPGTPGHSRAEDYLLRRLDEHARRAFKQEFQADTAFGGPYDFANLIGLFGPESNGRKLMLCAHWDTRPVADQDPDLANRDDPILGANDGASGVAVLLELARGFAETPPTAPVIIALWDAEDSGKSGAPGTYSGFLLGSEYFLKHMPDEATPDDVILLDMVGGDGEHNPRVGVRTSIGGNRIFDLPIEQNSIEAAPALVDEVYSAAERLGHSAFDRRRGFRVTDDHVPFIDAGIDAIDVIEFDYPEWHTVDDTPEHCDPDALKQVGETILEVVYSREP